MYDCMCVHVCVCTESGHLWPKRCPWTAQVPYQWLSWWSVQAALLLGAYRGIRQSGFLPATPNSCRMCMGMFLTHECLALTS